MMFLNNDVFERNSLVEWVREHGDCPITRKPVTLDQIKEDPSVYSINIKNVDFILNNKDELNKYSQKKIHSFVLYKKHLQEKLNSYEKAEFDNIMLSSQVRGF